MSRKVNFEKFGGVPMVRVADGGVSETAWNFGVLEPNEEVLAAAAAPTLYDTFPALQGKWDGKSTVNHHEAARRVLGHDLPAQWQRSGTCGGRTGSRALELLQCILMASGQRATFHYVSHAFIYAAARKEYGMLSGGEGVAMGSVPPVLAKYGAVHRDECEDKDPISPKTDAVANKWGRTGPPKEMYELAKDNIVTAMVRVRSAQELADALAAGGVGCCSDGQGFTTVRDQYGYCNPEGEWLHYHTHSGLRITKDGRKGFNYDQSWNEKTPGGPLVPGCPGNVFLVDWDTQDGVCKKGAMHVLFGFATWLLKEGKFDLDWLF